jgi:hypothetical protein
MAITLKREGNGVYTFTDSDGIAYRVYRTNDEPGNVDPVEWEVYTQDAQGASEQYQGSYPTLREVRESYTF